MAFEHEWPVLGCDGRLKSYSHRHVCIIGDIAADALQLPKDQRLDLAHRIMASLEPGPDAGRRGAGDGNPGRIRKYDAVAERNSGFDCI